MSFTSVKLANRFIIINRQKYNFSSFFSPSVPCLYECMRNYRFPFSIIIMWRDQIDPIRISGSWHRLVIEIQLIQSSYPNFCASLSESADKKLM